jgi:Cu-Zn family superoxide dismutase
MKPHLLLALIPGAMLFACSRAETPPPDSAASMPPPAAAEPATAMATLAGKSGMEVTGELQFTAAEGGVAMTGEISGLTQGSVHGFHVHERGDCSAPDAETAGGHLNPDMAPHGSPVDAAPPARHLGDMPNIQADEEGRASINAAIAGATLRDAGQNDLVGRSVIVHAMRDDYTTQPAGNSGDRIACGVIR